MTTNYNPMELMICVASRELEDGSTLAVGTGAPCAAAMLAQKLNSPNLAIMFEAGSVSPQLPEMPISVGDSRASYKAVMVSTMGAIMETCSRGYVDYTFPRRRANRHVWQPEFYVYWRNPRKAQSSFSGKRRGQ